MVSQGPASPAANKGQGGTGPITQGQMSVRVGAGTHTCYAYLGMRTARPATQEEMQRGSACPQSGCPGDSGPGDAAMELGAAIVPIHGSSCSGLHSASHRGQRRTR